MNMNYLKVIAAVTIAVLFSGFSVRASEIADVRHVSGEVTWVDLKLGKLQLEADVSPKNGEITEYRITEHETRVKAPLDKKFLTIADLLPGQHVIIDVIKGQEDKIVQKITADPRAVSDFQEAYGEIMAVDAAGTFTLAQRPQAGEEGENRLAYFVFEPEKIIVMKSPSAQPVQL
ncbi:MAG: hypothetical protein HQL21_08080, partial [Candidatus Omnitrophica bacterium]|nr:hypothetical protein [Candidatus Omnitrophota bacterium]